MKKKSRQKIGDFDKAFDQGKAVIDFSAGVVTEGLSRVVMLPPLSIPTWLAAEIENLSKIQAKEPSQNNLYNFHFLTF